MKALLLLLLLPLHALADTDLACRAGVVKFNFISGRGSIGDQGTALTIVANGILHTVIDTQVDTAVVEADKITANVTTVNRDGAVDDNSGQATIMLGLKDGQTDGTGQIRMIKNPKDYPGIVFRPIYPLSGCKGQVQ